MSCDPLAHITWPQFNQNQWIKSSLILWLCVWRFPFCGGRIATRGLRDVRILSRKDSKAPFVQCVFHCHDRWWWPVATPMTEPKRCLFSTLLNPVTALIPVSCYFLLERILNLLWAALLETLSYVIVCTIWQEEAMSENVDCFIIFLCPQTFW